MCLPNKIQAVNAAADLSNIFFPRVLDACKAFDGKAYKTTGERTKRFATLVESLELPNTQAQRVRLQASYGTVYLYVTASTYLNENWISHEEMFRIAKIDDKEDLGKLTYFSESFTPLKNDHNLADILAAQEQVKRLNEQAREISMEMRLPTFDHCW